LDGYVLDNTVYTANFEKEDNTKKVYEYTLDLQNLMTTIEFSKVDIANNYIENCDLELYKIEENEELTLIDSWNTTKEPHIIKGIKVGTKLVLKEKSAAKEFIIAEDINCNVKNTTEVQKITMIDKQVEISKVDVAGEEIEGAKLQVKSKNGEIIESWVSSKEPKKISSLVEGETYILHEELAIGNYVKATDIEFTVTTDKTTQRIEMIDKLVQVKKTDLVTGKEIDGAELIVTDENGEIIDQWISSSEEPHFVIGLEENKRYVLTERTCPYRL